MLCVMAAVVEHDGWCGFAFVNHTSADELLTQMQVTSMKQSTRWWSVNILSGQHVVVMCVKLNILNTHWCMAGSLRYGSSPPPCCLGVLRVGGRVGLSTRWICPFRRSSPCSWSQSPSGVPETLSTRMLAFHFLALDLPPRRSNSGGVTCWPARYHR